MKLKIIALFLKQGLLSLQSLVIKISTMKLKQVASIKAGYPFRGKIQAINEIDPCKTNPNYPHALAIQMKNVTLKRGIDWSSCIKTQLMGKRSPAWLQPGDILFTARGSHNYAILIDHSIAKQHAVAAPHFYVIQLQTSEVLPGYLAWLLNQSPCQRYFQREAEGSFAKSIRRQILDNTPIVQPSLSEQKNIIGLIRTLKQEQQIMEKLIDNGERFMHGIANQLFAKTSNKEKIIQKKLNNTKE